MANASGDRSARRAAAEVRGKTIRFTWTDGPTTGKTHEHVFHEDGSVEWRDGDAEKSAASQADGADGDAAGAAKKPRVEYAAVKITDDVCLVSYQSAEGYTLTVVLNFADSRITGFASGAKEWHPVQGTFQVVK